MPDKTLLEKYDHMWELLMQLDDPLCRLGSGDKIRALKDEIRETLAERTVYVVIQGFYSDQQVAGVFSTHLLAEEFKKLDEHERRIQKFPLDELTERAKKGLYDWQVWMEQNGDTLYASHGDGIGQMSPTFVRVSMRVAVDTPKKNRLVLYCDCWARNKEHAVKIANEYRARIIAANNWRNDYVWKEENNA